MNAPFQTPAGAGTINDPEATGEAFYFRSDNAADNMNLTVQGSLSGVGTSVTAALQGMLEVFPGATVDDIFGIRLASVAAGTVVVYGEGVAAQGTLHFESVPAEDDQFEIEFVGGIATETFTFKNPAVAYVDITAASVAASDYLRFDYSDANPFDPFVMYFVVDAVGSNGVGGTGVAINVLSADTDAQMATKLASYVNAATSPFSDYLVARVDDSITNRVYIVSKILSAGAMTSFGAGFSVTAVEAGTASASGQLRTGYAMDGSVAVPATMGETFANNFSSVTVSVVFSGSTVTYTDLVPCNRQLDWNVNQPVGTGISIIQPIGGVDGQQLVVLGAGELNAYDPVSLDKFAAPSGTLAGLLTFTSDWIVVSGTPADLWVSCDNVGSPITARYETTVDPSLSGGSARVGETAIGNIDDNTQRISIPERCEAIRFVILTNTNTAISLLDARLLYPS